MAKQNKYPFRLNGYIYSKGTRAGFLRMKRMGIPRPLFRIQDKLAKTAQKQYTALVRACLQDIKLAMAQTNAVQDQALVQDESIDDLMDFFDRMGKEYDDEMKAINRANMASAENTLQHKWLDNGDEEPSFTFANEIANTLQKEQDDYLVRLFQDAGDDFKQILLSFSLDKQQVFNDNMDNLRALYLDNSIQRLGWEQDYIKRAILEQIHKYVTGETDSLNLKTLTDYAYTRGDNMARLFARDQLQRFNKAMTLSTFTSAGVTKIKWVTSHDARVRPTHKALDGQIFDIKNLPDEIDDYNCRCGLVPVEWAD